MADATKDLAKREKLAAARRKLKQFQQKKGPPAPGEKNDKKAKKVKNNGSADGLEINGSAEINKQVLREVEGNGAVVESSTKVASLHSASPRTTAETSTISLPSSRTKSLDVSQDIVNTANFSNESSNLQPNQRLTASTERLQQLSRQINGLITQSSTYLSNNNNSVTLNNSTGLTELETRNRELASLLEQHNQLNEQLSKQLNELRQQNTKLQQQLDGEKKGFEERIKRELGALKEQLQVHIQTIGILVAEKTELQSSLNQSQKNAELRAEEIEELSGRLKASRQRVADLEKSFTTVSASSQKHEKSNKEYSKDIDRLKLDLYKLNKSNEEYQQQNSELQEKLQKKVSQCSLLEDSILELQGKLEMNELLVQQLQNTGGNAEVGQQIDVLLQEKSSLQAKVEQFEDAFQKLSAERDQLAEQYQQYIEQLTCQVQQLQEQVTNITSERDQLQDKQHELELSLSEMKSAQDVSIANSEKHLAEKTQLTQLLDKVKEDFEDMNKRYQAQIADNSQLSRLVEEGELKIQELELSLQRAGDSTVDRESLLESMQSDKTALSRAMAQNRELKNQLAELQNGFVKLSNDNMELLSQLSSEQHVARELAARLGQQEDELKDTREQLSKREHEMTELRSTSHAFSESQMSTEELDERLRKYEAQQTLLEHLQTELGSAQDAINSLTNQNSLLQAQLSENKTDANGNQDVNTASGEMMESLNSSVRQLEMERNQVLEQLQEETSKCQSIQSKLECLQHELASGTPATLNGDIISKAQFEALQHAMKQLENKYTMVMHDKADLSDRNEQLEHLIMQLQGETDTIGEYVTLYQQQRSILRQRQVEKDDYISRLARDREDMAEKIGQLQILVMQLLGERQMLHSYHDKENQTANQPVQPHRSTQSGRPAKPLEGTLDSSQLEDWPDYTSSDSETSEVEAIVGQSTSSETNIPGSAPQQSTNVHPSQNPSVGSNPTWTISSEQKTAHKIMNLLTEIGHSNLVDGAYMESSFLHCSHCRGKLLCV